MIQFFTGRDYGAPQVLEITVPALPADELANVDVSFIDDARGIVGVVTLMAFELQGNIGAAVLREYDAGRYSSVDLI